MHNSRINFSFSFLSFSCGIVGALFVAYIGLIAVVMSYAALTVEFSQSVRNDEAAVAVLESRYLDSLARITEMNYVERGYAKPSVTEFVRAKSVTALR